MAPPYTSKDDLEKKAGRVEVRRTDVWLVGPTRRLPKPAHVLNKNPDSVVGSDI